MIHSVGINPIKYLKNKILKSNFSSNPVQSKEQTPSFVPTFNAVKSVYATNTSMTANEVQEYNYLLNLLKNEKPSLNSENLTPNKQLDVLLRNGKLLAKGSDGKTTLHNLYRIATEPRTQGLNSKTLITNTLDILVNPRTVTQTFGDIPNSEKTKILASLKDTDEVKQNPELMDVQGSGTCAAASNEVNLANKYPAEFARWVEGLSSVNKAVYIDTKLSSISKNPLDAMEIIKLLEADKVKMDLNSALIRVTADDNAYIRANIQTNHWDKGERNVADVLIQSAIMQLGSQGTYNALSDRRAGNFNSNPQGLIEVEKTFVESLIKNKEITSLIYQQIDENQNLVGYNCSFEKMQQHITNTIDSGEDVIIGYVLTNETAGRTTSGVYNSAIDGAPNKVINGHEITIVDYVKDENGEVSFICVDTDDDDNQFVKLSASWLLPKLHHAGYPAKIVEADEKQIMQNAGYANV